MKSLANALRFAATVALLIAAFAARSGAQGLEQPLRSAPPPDANRTTQHLTVSASVLGGYDDQLGAQGLDVQSLDTAVGGYTGLADVGLRYRRGKAARSFYLEGSSYLLSYSALSIDSPVGGQVGVGGVTKFGRSHQLDVKQYARTDPYVAFGAFGPLRQDLGPGVGPDANPVNGLAPSRSWGAATSVSVDSTWTPRTTLSTGYDYLRNEYIGDGGFDNRMHAARLSVDQSLTRAFTLVASSRYADTVVVDPLRNERWPIKEVTGEVGFEYAKAVSRTRRIEFSAQAGATHVDTVNRAGGRSLEYWAPSGRISGRADIGRTWAISGDYRRGVTLLDGITPESFLADAMLLRAEGLMTRRVELTFSSGYSNGKQQAQLITGRYDAFTLSVQGRYVISQPWAVVVSYNRTDYRLFGFPPPPLGPTAQHDRNAIRVGMTYFFTLTPRAQRPVRPGRRES